MKKGYLFFLLSVLMAFTACRDDESYKEEQPDDAGNRTIGFTLTGRVGTVVGSELTDYIESLNLFLFRENAQGDYILYRSRVLDQEELKELTQAPAQEQAGYTVPKVITFDSVPLATYKIVGVGNALDSLGTAIPEVTWSGITPGARLTQIITRVTDTDQPSRLFWGITEPIEAGGNGAEPSLALSRKVSMFALTLRKIPNVVNRIGMEIARVYGAFDMAGSFVGGNGNYVFASQDYTPQPADSITLTYISLPTVQGDSSLFTTTFYIEDGPKQVIRLPEYVLKPNTITKVTATIDTDQGSGAWKVDVTSLITVNVEWNIDQEPPVTI